MSDNNEDNRQQETAEEQPAVQETAEEQPVAAETVEEQPTEQVAAEEQPSEEPVNSDLTVIECKDVTVVENEEQPEPAKKAEIQLKEINTGSIMDALKCMVSFFTIIRLDVGEKECDAMERNFWLVPVIGAINGFVAFIVCLILGLLGMDWIIQSICALATVFIFSKFLHFDGLVDFGDGIVVSSGNQEDHVRALKDSLIGAGGFGVALIVTLISFFSLGEVSGFVQAWANENNIDMTITVAFIVFPLEILIKNAQVVAAAFGQPGNGMASKQVSNTGISDVIYSTILTTVLVIIACLICWGIASACPGHLELPMASVLLVGLVAGLLTLVVGFGMAYISNKTFGFVNGDILGATNDITRAVVLLVSLILLTISLW